MSMVDIDLDLLRALVFVYESGSFTKAAQLLFRSQSAISLKIKKLEELIGKKLLLRQQNSVELTDFGSTVYAHAVQMLKLNDDLLTAVGNITFDNVIRFGTPDDYLQLYLPELANTSLTGGYEIHIVNELSINLPAMVDSGDLDLALFTDLSISDSSQVFKQSLSWVSSPNFTRNFQTPLPLALFPKGCQVRDDTISLLREANVNHQVICSSIQFAPLLSVITSGHAVGVLPSNAIPPGLQIYRSHDLPNLPDVSIRLKLAPGASYAVRTLASSIARCFELID